MRKTLLITVFLTVTTAVSHAAEFQFSEGADINIGILKGDIVPSLTLPIHWGQSFYSVMGLHIYNTSESTTLSSFSESRNAIFSREIEATLSPIGYRNSVSFFSYFLSLNYNYRNTERKEFGYIHLPNVLGGDWVSHENNVNFDIHSVSLSAAIVYRAGNLYVKLSAAGSPWHYMNLKQDTMMKPIISNDADLKTSSTGKGLSYQLLADTGYKFNEYLGIKVYLGYDFLPLKYDLELADYEAATSTFYFAKERIDEENIKIIYGAQLFFPAISAAKLSPTIGYEIREIYVKYKNSDSSSGSIEGVIIAGFTYNW
ncbi:MAG: hypothetical protein LBH05_06800 [Deferribacteraceae bacterium]|jgi:hypothetical protein|nr:hypothetical protein [Deferribacteraceae bacterium]